MAFYATFLPSRASTRASGLLNATDGLTYSGVVVAQSRPEPISVSITSSPRTETLPPPKAEPFSAGLLLDLDQPGARLSAATVSSLALNAGCDTSQSPIYCVYTVQQGDTLGSIAGKFGLKNGEVLASDLLVQSNKPDIASADDFIQPGQKLRIPVQTGVIHTVRGGDTATAIAETYDVPLAEIVAVAANGLSDLNNLKIGQELLVPNPTRFSKPAPPPPAASSGGGSSGSAPQVIGGSQQSRSGFIWPVRGPISSYFTPSHPLGIDIDLITNPRAPIAAATAGTVTFAGGNPCCSYGYYVVIDHGNGFQTLYAHLSSVSVSVGQRVVQGQVLGYAGLTGYVVATGGILHFEVYLNGAVVNPLTYLP